MLSDDELARAIDSLSRKLRSARRMYAIASGGRIAFWVVMVASGFLMLATGPAPFVELIQGRRVLATTWDVFVWWFAVLLLFSLLGAAAVQAARRRRRRAQGWKQRVADLERRLAEAVAVQTDRGQR